MAESCQSSRCRPMLQFRMYGVRMSGSIVLNPRGKPNVKNDCGIGNVNDAGNVDSGGTGDVRLRPPGGNPACPGLRKTLCVIPGFEPAAVENVSPPSS